MPSTGSRYVMLFLAYEHPPERWESFEWHGLHCAWSTDARHWRVGNRPVVSHRDIEETAFVCSPFLLAWSGKYYIVYHKDTEDPKAPGSWNSNIHCAEIDPDLKVLGESRFLCRREVFGRENLRASDPCLVHEDDVLYLFTAVGPRLNQRIGLATASVGRAPSSVAEESEGADLTQRLPEQGLPVDGEDAAVEG